MALAWLKISLHCIIQRCLIPTRFTRTLYPVLAISSSLNQTGTAPVQVQVNPRTEVMIVTSAVAGRSSWSLTEERCLIADYKYYNRLTSPRSSQDKKTIWEDILKQFQSVRFDNGVESEKSLGQLKEKWRALMDKHKSLCDNDNRTGRERKRFKDYEDIDEFMASSDKVNPRCVKETKAHKQDCSSDDTDSILSTGNQDCGKKPEKRPATSAEGESEDAEITLKTGQKEEKVPKKKKKRLSGDEMGLAILEMMTSQQESMQRSEENDERVFEALLKSHAEMQQQHQEFVVSMLGKLGDIFASKK